MNIKNRKFINFFSSNNQNQYDLIYIDYSQWNANKLEDFANNFETFERKLLFDLVGYS